MKEKLKDTLEHKVVYDMKHKGSYGIGFCVCVAAAYCVLLRLMELLCSGILSVSANSYWMDGILRLILAGLLFYVLSGLKEAALLKEKGAGFLSGLKAGGFHLAIVLLSFISSMTNDSVEGQLQPAFMILGFVVASFAVGLAEELLNRGLILNVLLNRYGRDTAKGIWMSVAISGMIFGALHISNLFTDGRTVISVFVQILYAAAVGMYFGAVYMRCGNIWVLIFLHTMNDFVVEMSYGVWGIGSETSITNASNFGKLRYVIIYMLLTVFLLRKKKMMRIIERSHLTKQGGD
ncbi:MAG: CPBP family intramembrane metalloprotease [Clostridiales bacterium]|nr:CPBP family intramembrane metalloprotease [Clostridiales bacterium]